MKKVIIIDVFGFLFRFFYALPPLKNKDGFPTGLLTGFINFVHSLEKNHKQSYVIFALDSPKRSFRKDIYGAYKQNRKSPPDDFLKQTPIIIDWINKMGFKSFSIPSYEADDVIASIVKLLSKEKLIVKIVTYDKDLYQLIKNDKVLVLDPISKRDIGSKECVDKLGVLPSMVCDFLSLAGDSSDNIPGAKGIGPKGACSLVNKFKTIENIYNNIENIERKNLRKLLLSSKDNVFLSRKLIKLNSDLISKIDIKEAKYPEGSPILKIKNNLEEYGIKSIFKNNKNNHKKVLAKDKKLHFKPILLDDREKLFNVINNIPPKAVISIDTETDSLDTKVARIVGFSFCYNELEAYYIPIAHKSLIPIKQISKKDAKIAINAILSRSFIGHNLKYDLEIIKNNFDIQDVTLFADTMIMSWLINPQHRNSLDVLSLKYFDYDMLKFKEVVPKGSNFSYTSIAIAYKYAAEDAWMSLKLFNKINDILDEELREEATCVEYPFINVLRTVESFGFKIDILTFKKFLHEANIALERLKKDIFDISDIKFNINSVKQLADILYNKLKIKPLKKTKTGYSTDERTLVSLSNEHPIIEKILDYRSFFKLKSTYIEPILRFAERNDNSRVYTSFSQTGTATGRLSSKNPNLQNIPTKAKKNNCINIREGFISKKGCMLVSIDYSQIELRLLAHFSQDRNLLEAFMEDKDIHLETSSKLFGHKQAKIKRDVAKSINFGLLYGMGPRKLSQTINIRYSEAKDYIDSYFKSFPTVKLYISNLQHFVEKNGYIKTLLNRKRFFDFVNLQSFRKAEFLREAVNTVFQGSAADLIKLSMIAISKILESYRASMILQIHDELLFEVEDKFVDTFICYAKEIMEKIYTLKVPLRVSCSKGYSWANLKR